MIDQRDRAVETDWQSGRIGFDRRAISFDDAPIHAAIGIAAEVPHRDAIEFDAIHIAAFGVEQRVPAAAGFEQFRRRKIVLSGGVGGAQAGVELMRGRCESGLVFAGKSQIQALLDPCRGRFIDREPIGGGNLAPRVLIGGMEPAAAEIEREGAEHARVRAPANSIPGFENANRYPFARQPLGCGQPGGPGADDNNLEISDLQLAKFAHHLNSSLDRLARLTCRVEVNRASR